MKRTDLEKLAGKRVANALQHATPPARFAEDAGAAALSRRERRRLDQARGLVPFAVKIDSALVAQVHALARARAVTVDELIAELLRKGLSA